MRGLSLNNKKTAQKIIKFLKNEFQKRNKTKAILGLSGGVDSSVTAIFCKRAGLDLYIALMPYGFSSRKDCIKNSRKIIELLSLDKDHVFLVDIKPIVDAQIKKLSPRLKLNQVSKGNIMARQRMIILYAMSNHLGGLVVGTGNLSEYWLGYFTLYGDQACDINPIGGLWKTQLTSLAKYLGVPQELLSKKPTADLWPGQTDEGELGFNYNEADPILYLHLYKKLSRQKIAKKLKVDLSLINQVLERVENTKYKRELPPQA